MNRKIFAVIIAACFVSIAMTACGSKEQIETGSGMTTPGMVTGGWEINNDDTIGWATDEAKAAFNKAMEGFTGAEYTIISQIGRQLVAGMNYMFVCKERTVTEEPVNKLSVVTIYEDLEGTAKVTNVVDLDLGELYGKENPAKGKDSAPMAGGWLIPDSYQAVNLPVPVSTVFDKVLGEEAKYVPMAFLGSQVVNGTNYAVLCFDESEPYIVYLYAPLEGAPELVSVYRLYMGELSGN